LAAFGDDVILRIVKRGSRFVEIEGGLERQLRLRYLFRRAGLLLLFFHCNTNMSSANNAATWQVIYIFASMIKLVQ
jgi:hypothetical protein